MTQKTQITLNNTTYDCSDAVEYHYGVFPPAQPDLNRLLMPLSDAIVSLTKFDTMLQNMQNSELLLAPLRARDAVVSSRMEGTISTLEEVLRLEADSNEESLSPSARNETLEVALYARAIKQAERHIEDGYAISENLIRGAHLILLSFGRGAEKRPGEYKAMQNYVGDRRKRKIEFIPIAPEQLAPGMASLIEFIRNNEMHPLLKTAIAHAEFEALHPFEDGNGRLGRMVITLMLWETKTLSAPHFFVSDYFEQNKSEYVDRLRAVSDKNDWTGWCEFFLTALRYQADNNIKTVGQIQIHYDRMREVFRDLLRSRWSSDALDYIFANPIFRNNRFKREAGIPEAVASGFTNRLVEAGHLETLLPPAGRMSGLFVFPSLLDIVRDHG
ncbi:MAG: Fic family protein [Paracoccaceae bacterium]